MEFLDFRPVTRGRLRRSRIVFWGLMLGALALYVATALRAAFPGESAQWIAWAAGLDVQEIPSHPLFSLLGKWVAGVPVLSLAWRLNLLSAIAGALTVGWVYGIVWFWIFEFMREESAVVYASRIARFGGIAAALAVGLNLPFWLAATRFQPDAFDIALLMGCLHALTVYARTRKGGWLLLFGALYGAGVAESALFIVAAPFALALVLITEWKAGWFNVGRVFSSGLLAVVALGGITFWSVRTHVLGQGMAPDSAALLAGAISVWREQAAWIMGLVAGKGWLVALLLGAGLAVLALFASMRSLDNRRSWSMYLLSLVLTVAAFLTLFNAPFTQWGLDAARGIIPAATYLWAGMGIGLLIASWRALAALAIPDGLTDSGDDPGFLEERNAIRLYNATHGTALLAAPALTVALLVAGVLNGVRVCSDDGAFADQAADEVLDSLTGRTWLVANGLIDANLLIRAHERRATDNGTALHLLCPYRARGKAYTAAVLAAVQADPSFSESAKLRAASLMETSLHLFIDDLFATDSDIGTKAICMGMPDLWYGSKYVPVPERLFFGGVKDAKAINTGDLLAAHHAFWERWQKFLDEGEGRPRDLSRRYRLALRRHMAFGANNLGVTLVDAERLEDAFAVFDNAREAYADNISALLNQFSLVSQGVHPERKFKIEEELRERVERDKDRYSLWALSRYYGYVRDAELFVRMGWRWAFSSSPGAVLAGLRNTDALQMSQAGQASAAALIASLHAMQGDTAQSKASYRQALVADPKNVTAVSGLARLAMQEGGLDEARKILEAGEESGVPARSLRLDWVALQLAAGELPQARTTLQEVCDAPDASPAALAMLAMVMIEQGDVSQVEAKLLPRLEKTTTGRDSYFTQIIRGRVWQSKGRPGYEKARSCYLRAMQLRPDVQGVLDVVLGLDMALADQKGAEARAFRILRQYPDHPQANFVIGTIRLQQGQYGDAEGYLARSVSGERPTMSALNNYAEVLCRIRKLDMAEQTARRAIEVDPERYEGWSTLAFVLAEKEQPEPAAEALAKARSLDSKDKRLELIAALIALKRGDVETAEKALARGAWDAELSTADKLLSDELRSGIERQKAEKRQ